MELGLGGRHCLVTAASRGLGRAVALGLTEEGARVSLCARDGEALETTADELRKSGGEVTAMPADVGRAEDVERLLAAAHDSFGDIDVLFANAPGPPLGTFGDFDDAAWQATFESVLLSAVRLVRGALPDMLRRGWGRIIVSTSITVLEPQPNLLLSTSLRAAVAGLVKTLVREVASSGVTVNAVVPDRILTDRTRSNAAHAARLAGRSFDEELERRSAAIPMGRYGTPDEYAKVVVFLASDAASYLTGVNLRVDGGRYGGLF